LIETKGNIINVSSDDGLKATTFGMFYAITKAGLDHFTKCLALELGPKGVRVNSVNLGYVPDTDVFSRAGVTGEQEQDFRKTIPETVPLRRSGELDEVCDAALFVASDKAKFVTGTLIPVDGGSSAR